MMLQFSLHYINTNSAALVALTSNKQRNISTKPTTKCTCAVPRNGVVYLQESYQQQCAELAQAAG